MADVFLSYARENLSEAQRFATRLKSYGFSTWFDEKLPAHRSFSEVIEEQLEAARAVVVLLVEGGGVIAMGQIRSQPWP